MEENKQEKIGSQEENFKGSRKNKIILGIVIILIILFFVFKGLFSTTMEEKVLRAYDAKDYTMVLTYEDEIMNGTGDPELLEALLMSYYRLDKLQEGLGLYQEMEKRFPLGAKDSGIQVILGNIYFRLEKIEDGILAFEESFAEPFPNNEYYLNSYLNYLKLLEKSGQMDKWDEAIRRGEVWFGNEVFTEKINGIFQNTAYEVGENADESLETPIESKEQETENIPKGDPEKTTLDMEVYVDGGYVMTMDHPIWRDNPVSGTREMMFSANKIAESIYAEDEFGGEPFYGNVEYRNDTYRGREEPEEYYYLYGGGADFIYVLHSKRLEWAHEYTGHVYYQIEPVIENGEVFLDLETICYIFSLDREYDSNLNSLSLRYIERDLDQRPGSVKFRKYTEAELEEFYQSGTEPRY